jgi:GntR family transcriptional regulator
VPLDFELDYDRGVPVYRQITEAVLTALASGALAQSEQLPTIHQLAARLGVNPNTVARSYRELEQQGHIKSQRGRGTFPAVKAPPKSKDRQRVLREIYDRALADGARHGLDATQIADYFKKASS